MTQYYPKVLSFYLKVLKTDIPPLLNSYLQINPQSSFGTVDNIFLRISPFYH